MSEHDYIDGELAEDPGTTDLVESGGLPEAQAQSAQAMQVFNPLDAQPATFTAQLQQRQENYDNLALHLRSVLVPDKDFGRIHVVGRKKCQSPWSCQNPAHFSDYQLFAPGADKILGILGLAVHYPDLKDYRRAALSGVRIEDVMAEAQILSSAEQVIAEGAGACSRQEMDGDLNRTIKRACKRARLDAVLRLPVVSALFESDFLAQVAQDAARNKGNTTASRAQRANGSKKWDTGAELQVCPIGKEIKGKPWRDIDTQALEWLVHNVTDKPDITRAARRELDKRGDSPPESSAEPHSTRNGEPPVFPE